MKRYLSVLALSLTACGSSQTIQPAAVQFVALSGSVSYGLTATANDKGPQPASLTVNRAASVTMPKYVNALSNANWVGRADLAIGNTFCAFQNNGQGVYVRQDGSCNTFAPDAAINVVAGDTVSLTLEGCPDHPTSIEATITGQAI